MCLESEDVYREKNLDKTWCEAIEKEKEIEGERERPKERTNKKIENLIHFIESIGTLNENLR